MRCYRSISSPAIGVCRGSKYTTYWGLRSDRYERSKSHYDSLGVTIILGNIKGKYQKEYNYGGSQSWCRYIQQSRVASFNPTSSTTYLLSDRTLAASLGCDSGLPAPYSSFEGHIDQESHGSKYESLVASCSSSGEHERADGCASGVPPSGGSQTWSPPWPP